MQKYIHLGVLLYQVNSSHLFFSFQKKTPATGDPEGITKVGVFIRSGNCPLNFQENYNTPLEHTPGNPPTQLWKDSLYNLLVKV